MLPAEIQAAIANDPAQQAGYQGFRDWVAAGAKHGSYAGLMRNEAAVTERVTPWGENQWFDANGNGVSLWRLPRPGEVSPYGGAVVPGSGGPSAPGPVSSFAASVFSLLPGAPGSGGAGRLDAAGLQGLLDGPQGKLLGADELAALRRALAGLPRQQFQVPS